MLSSVFVFGHALIEKKDVPVPDWLFAWAAALVLIVSFFALSVAWRTPRLERGEWRALGSERLSRVLLGRGIEVVCGVIGVAYLGVAVWAAYKGTEAPDRNGAVTMLFVTAWLGFPFLGVFAGDLFRAFNPWRAIGRVVGSATAPIRGGEGGLLEYPERLGRRPAAIGVIAFVWLEIVYGVKGSTTVGVMPHDAGVAVLVYSLYTFGMMGLFGVEKWCRNGESFSVLFGMFASISPVEVQDGRLGRRKAFTGISAWMDEAPGSLWVVLASVAGTTFDGASEGTLSKPRDTLTQKLGDGGLSPASALHLSGTIYFIVTVAAVVGVYLIGVQGMRTVRRAPPSKELRRAFAHSLVPIAFAYLFAHYFTLAIYQEQAQFTYLLSNPLGDFGTDYFGTANGSVDYRVISANAIWYTQVAALLIGHVLGLALAHDKALTLWKSPKEATRSQYWMLAVMVVFTSLGLFLLSEANS